MMVHDCHMSVYDKDSALILVMATDVPDIRPLISSTYLLILPNSVPGCFRDWYMLAHPALLCSRLHPAGPLECVMYMYPSYTAIYQHIPSYDGIRQYMSGYQGVRIPDESIIIMQATLCHSDY
jgi:hypothetical protein